MDKVYVFLVKGKERAKITASTQAKAEMDFRKMYPRVNMENVTVKVKGKVRKPLEYSGLKVIK